MNGSSMPNTAPKNSIDDSIYADLFTISTFVEWLDVVRTTPANKAPGPSGISYDLIKHFGPVALEVLYQLTCSCFLLKAIPVGWKRAAIYLIPNQLHGIIISTIHDLLLF